MSVSWDYADYSDYGDDTAANSSPQGHTHDTGAALQEGIPLIPHCEQMLPQQQNSHLQDADIISVINRNQRNQSPGSAPAMDKEVFLCEAEPGTAGENERTSERRDRCPHHPRARLVRFDPAGQAWCDHLDCWCCYRLMKIGEALDYRCLTERGGQRLIPEGIEAWATYVRTQRTFLVAWATQSALALCHELGIQEPDLSGEVKRLIEVQAVSS